MAGTNGKSVAVDFECSSSEQSLGAVLLQVYGVNLSWVIRLVVWQCFVIVVDMKFVTYTSEAIADFITIL